jgi:large subunit ribosomal protein L13
MTLTGGNTALTILCSLRYRKDFGSSVVARLMVLASSSGNQRAVFLSQPFFNLGEFPMSTYFPKQGEIVRKWYVVDADGQTLGRLASQVARILMGKENPQYTPFLDTGDHVIVINAEKIRTTGVKAEQKVYQHYTGYPGGLRTEEYKKRMLRKPEAVIEAAVKRMLPKNKLAAHMLSKLNVYKGDKHPHQAQKPQELKLEVRA